MWDLPRPGLEPVSPALAGRFSTTAPPGKPWCLFLKRSYSEVRYMVENIFIGECRMEVLVLDGGQTTVYVFFYILELYGLS